MRFNAVGNRHKIYFLPTTETGNYNDMTAGIFFFFFWSAGKKEFKEIWNDSKKATGQGDDNTAGFSLDYNHFKI